MNARSHTKSKICNKIHLPSFLHLHIRPGNGPFGPKHVASKNFVKESNTAVFDGVLIGQ